MMAMVMEGLHGSESRVRYDVIGHSGEHPHIPFVKRDLPPDNEKKRLQVLEVRDDKMQMIRLDSRSMVHVK